MASNSDGARRGHEKRRASARLTRCRDLAREAFLEAAQELAPPHLTSARRDPATAVALGALGLLRLAQSDPDNELLDRAMEMIRGSAQGGSDG